MAEHSARYVGVYDVTEHRERLRVARILEGFGFRVQFSAFEFRLTRSMRERMLADLRALNLETGWFVLYRIDSGSKDKFIGKVPERPFADDQHCYLL